MSTEIDVAILTIGGVSVADTVVPNWAFDG